MLHANAEPVAPVRGCDHEGGPPRLPILCASEEAQVGRRGFHAQGAEEPSVAGGDAKGEVARGGLWLFRLGR
eukprot:8439431-Alexandrium_andersonii.AAC.1